MTHAASTIHRAAPAKINLYLHVTGRRPDGYHLLDSLVAFARVHDTLSAAPADELSIAISGPFAEAAPPGDDNLVLRAAQALADAAGVSAGARLALVKRLPVAAGIGGGSADAAAALSALSALWNVSLPVAQLQALALGLGADVPVCIAGRAAWVGGVGEEIDAAPRLPAVPAVLVNPRRPLSTAAVFGARSGLFSKPARADAVPETARDLAAFLAARGNDLETPATALEPAIATALGAIGQTNGCMLARMSGSGATCFGLYDAPAEAARAADAIARAEPDWWVCETALAGDESELEPTNPETL